MRSRRRQGLPPRLNRPMKPARWCVEVYRLGVSYHVVGDERSGYIDGDANEVKDFNSQKLADAFAQARRADGHAAMVMERINIRWVYDWPEGWWEFDWA